MVLFNKTKGFSVLEVVLAVSILGILLVMTAGTYFFGQESVLLVGNRAYALSLAEEGLEAVRALRDENFANLQEGTFGLEYADDIWQLIENPDTDRTYTRSITLLQIDPNTYQVAAQVEWQQNQQRTGTVELQTYLSHWQKEKKLYTFRVQEYFVNPSDFLATSYVLDLSYDLMPNYFVIVQGSDGSGTNDGSRGPDDDYVRLVADPFGTGDLAISGQANQLNFERMDFESSWVGVITVVECLSDCSTSGFELIDVISIQHDHNQSSGGNNSQAWTSLGSVVPVGGFNGAGCVSADSQSQSHSSCHVRLWPSGTNTINWSRADIPAAREVAESTVMVTEWGSEWSVQHVNIVGNAGGDGVNEITHYNSAEIASVARDTSWLWGTGWTSSNGSGSSAEGSVVTLGNGVDMLPVETRVAVGQEHQSSKIDDTSFDIYVLSHEDLQVDYLFKPDGNNDDLVYDLDTEDATDPTARMSIIYNSGTGTGGGTYPRSLWSARYLDEDSIRLERRRYNGEWAAWVQGINFENITP